MAKLNIIVHVSNPNRKLGRLMQFVYAIEHDNAFVRMPGPFLQNGVDSHEDRYYKVLAVF